MRLAPLVLLILLAGCLRVGPGEDLHLVCERERTSPWHPYAPDELQRLTRPDPPLDRALARDLFRDLADRIVTPGAAPYEAFESRLFQEADGRWRFLANGTWPGGVDRYDIGWPAPEGPIEATAWLRQQAIAVAANESALAGAGEVQAATWSEELPGCVRLAYPAREVWVNVDTRLVVSIDGPPTTGGNA